MYKRQGFESRLHQSGDAAAQHGLLAEQIGFGFHFEGGFEHAGAGTADARGIGEGHIERAAGGILMDGDEAGHALALDIFAADGMTLSLIHI